MDVSHRTRLAGVEKLLKIIDSHIHFWHPEILRYPWLDDLPALKRAFLPADYAWQGQGWIVEKAVFVQAACLPEQGYAEAVWVASLVDQGAPVAGIVAFVPLELGERARPALEALRTVPLVRGVRRLIQSEVPGFCIQPDFFAGVRLLAEFGYTFDICVQHHQLLDVIVLVKACPDVRFILDHGGKPNIKGGTLDPWREHIRQLAAFPNVVCKLSGLITEADHKRWQPSELLPYIDHLLNCFGSKRLMFGSDWPVVRLVVGGERWIELLLDSISSLSPNEITLLFYENTRRFYDLPAVASVSGHDGM